MKRTSRPATLLLGKDQGEFFSDEAGRMKPSSYYDRLVDVMEEQALPKTSTTKVMGGYSWEFYEQAHGEETVENFRKGVENLDALAKQMNWNRSRH